MAGVSDPPPVADLRDELLGLFVAVLEGARPAFEYVEALRADDAGRAAANAATGSPDRHTGRSAR